MASTLAAIGRSGAGTTIANFIGQQRRLAVMEKQSAMQGKMAGRRMDIAEDENARQERRFQWEKKKRLEEEKYWGEPIVVENMFNQLNLPPEVRESMFEEADSRGLLDKSKSEVTITRLNYKRFMDEFETNQKLMNLFIDRHVVSSRNKINAVDVERKRLTTQFNDPESKTKIRPEQFQEQMQALNVQEEQARAGLQKAISAQNDSDRMFQRKKVEDERAQLAREDEQAHALQKQQLGIKGRKEVAEIARKQEIKTGELQPSTITSIEKDINKAYLNLDILDFMKEYTKDDYLRAPGKLYAWMQRKADSLHPALSSSKGIEFAKAKAKWKLFSDTYFLKWRKFITGVSGGQQELERIAKSAPDAEEDGPEIYRAKLEAARELTVAAINRLEWLKVRGADPEIGDKEAWKMIAIEHPLSDFSTIQGDFKKQQKIVSDFEIGDTVQSSTDPGTKLSVQGITQSEGALYYKLSDGEWHTEDSLKPVGVK